MTRGSRAAAILPVRLDSRRLPKKALLSDSGQPLFLHTWEQTRRADCFEQVYVATDSDEIEGAATAAGAPVIRTSNSPRTGSERCAEAARDLDVDIVVDVQADWPEIDPEDLTRLVMALRDQDIQCTTLAVPIEDPEKMFDPNVVKVVRALNGNALYFSRAPIPFAKKGDAAKGETSDTPRLRHIGIYGFRRETLLRLSELPSSGLAETEELEQLRFLENGITIDVLIAHHHPWGIESPGDYRDFLARLAQRRKAPSS